LILEINSERKKMNEKFFHRRTTRFYRKLIEMTSHYHTLFLQSLPKQQRKSATQECLAPSSKTKGKHTLVKWHSLFNLETVPSINPSPLPTTPTRRPIRNKLPSVKADSKDVHIEKIEDEEDGGGGDERLSLPLPSELDGVSLDIIHNVRKKERQRKELESKQQNQPQSAQYIINSLPMICDSIRGLFSLQRRNVLQYDVIVDGLRDGFSISLNEWDIIFSSLIHVVPQWLQEVVTEKDLMPIQSKYGIRSQRFYRMNPKVSFVEIRSVICQYVKQNCESDVTNSVEESCTANMRSRPLSEKPSLKIESESKDSNCEMNWETKK
jgi:hypothetical protein